MESVVPQDQHAWVRADKLGTDMIGLRQTFRTGLLSVTNADAPSGAIAQKVLKRRRIGRRCYD